MRKEPAFELSQGAAGAGDPEKAVLNGKVEDWAGRRRNYTISCRRKQAPAASHCAVEGVLLVHRFPDGCQANAVKQISHTVERQVMFEAGQPRDVII